MNKIQTYIKQRENIFVDELKAFLRIPSVSADSACKEHMLAAADFLYLMLEKAGMDSVQQIDCGGNLIVFAEKKVNKDAPTVLIYGHYDVQPADPLDLWISPPFEPEIREGKIYARGACDDKAQVFLIVKTLEMLKELNTWNCNVKLVFEGEEETGSASLNTFVEEYRHLLKADVLLVCDTAMPALNEPAIITGLRGIVYGEIKVTGAPCDLHSGMFGGCIVNPLFELCKVLGEIKDENDSIQIPGFYEGVQTNEETDTNVQLPYAGFHKGEAGFSFTQRQTLRPSFDVNGISGGYAGEGPKTIIPNTATAKISFRLAAGQDAQDIVSKVSDFIREKMPAQIKTDISLTASCNAIRVNSTSVACKSAALALEQSFGKKPVFHAIGGSIPVVSLFHKTLGLEPLLMGFGLDSDNIHAPNEHFHLSNFYKGMETLFHFFHAYSSGKKNQKKAIEALDAYI